MNKLLQYLINETNVEGRVMPGLQKMQRGGQKTLPKMQIAGQYNAERDATSVNTTAANKMFGAQRNVDVDKLSEDSFKEKYKMTPHQYKMRTDADYAQSFQRQMDQIRQSPNYSEINLPATDVRSKNYRGNPNLALIPKGSTGPARASQEQLFADMTSLAAPLLPIKSLVRGLQAIKTTSAAPKIVDRVASVPTSLRSVPAEPVNDSGLIINEEVYRQWANARRKANIPESRSAIRSSTPPPSPPPSPQSMQAWGTGNWDGSTIIPADNIQPYRPVWPGSQLRNTTISPLDFGSFVEDRADRLIGATRKIDEKLGKLFSKTTNAPAFDADEVTRLINENLSKGVGVKKENLALQVRNSPLPYDLETGFRIETLIDNNKVGSILFQRNMNPYKPKKLSQILLDKLPTPFDRWRNTPGFKKTNDFPFQDYDPFKPIKDPTGKTFNTANDLYSTGISGEFNKAVNEALKAKGLGNVLSGGTGHSTLGGARWKKLVEKGLAEDLGDGYYKLKKEGGPVFLPKMQSKGEVKDSPEKISVNDPRYREMYKNRQVGLKYDDAISLPDLDEVTVTAPRSYSTKSLRDFTTAALYGAPAVAMKLSAIPQAAMTEGIEALRGKPYDFSNIDPNIGGFSSNQRDLSQTMGYENPQGFLQNAANVGLSMIDPSIIAGTSALLRQPIQRGARAAFRNPLVIGSQSLDNVAKTAKPRINWGEEYFKKIQNKDKELQELVFSKKITDKEYSTALKSYEEDLRKKLGLGKELGRGNYGSVYELEDEPFKVIKVGNPMTFGSANASKWTPELIENLKSVRQNANISIPENVDYYEIPSVWKGYGPTTKEVLTMPNLNKVSAQNLNLNKRDRYALFLKQARQLRDKGIKLDVDNPKNFQFNKDKGVFDIYDVNPGSINDPSFYMQYVRNKTKGPLFEDMRFKQGGPILDPRGQWAHPGKRTIVPTPTGRITMQGVPYPVYGQDETGFGQMMYPGGEYKFPGQMVDEIPMMRNGGGLLSKSVTCSNCGWSWKAVEGGSDPLTCHKCGGTVKMQLGGLLQPITAQDISNVLSLFSVPQKVITKAVTGKYQTPSEAMGIKNPYGAFAADAVLDPVNLVGAGLLGKMAKASTKTGLLSNTYKINPWRFKPKEGMMYRGLGQEGLDDALQSGVLRPKQYNFPEKRSLIERVESPKQFGTTYYAPAKKFDVVSNYGDGYIAEVPFDGNLFSRRYGRKDWSWSTPKQISIEEANLLEKDWLKGYKPVKLPNKKTGGQHGGLDRWFAEKWVDVKTGKACGRQEGEKRAGYPACRPSKRVSSETPKTSSEMSSAEKAKFKASKTSSQRIDYNHKRNK